MEKNWILRAFAQFFSLIVSRSLTRDERGMFLAAADLEDGDVVRAEARQVVQGLARRHLRAEAELPVPIGAPREDLSKF